MDKCHRIDIINCAGIPVVHIFEVKVTETQVIYKLPRGFLGRLRCREGLLIIDIEVPATGGEALPVFISDGCKIKPLIYGNGQPFIGSDIIVGNNYVFIYDKCADTIKLLNGATVRLEPTAVAASAESASLMSTSKK